MSKKISQYLYESEYRCKHCDALPPDLKEEDGVYPVPFQILFDAFDDIREHWGKPIHVSSGYRCPMHNAFVGGKVLSAHMFGLALDCACDEPYELAELVEEFYPDLRRGLYDWGIHIDTAYYIFPRASYKWHEGATWTG